MSDDGGPAFPADERHVVVDPVTHRICKLNYIGMSMRDYFAAKAMAAIVVGVSRPEIADIPDNASIAAVAYALADAMLNERKTKAE
jgi:hypothetical protein